MKVENEEYSALSNGKWIPKNTPVTITHVDGTKIVVSNKEE
ncbi:NfeD family protein [Terrihalobacillus insolitus]